MTFRARHILLAMACVTAMHSLPLPAQSASLVSASDADASSSAAPVVMSTIPVVTPPATPKPLTARWLDLTTFSHSQRYRNQYGDTGYHYFEDGQQRSVLAGKIKLDSEGKYDIGFRASSGNTFNWAYADYAGQGFAARLDAPGYQQVLQQNAKDGTSNGQQIATAQANDPAGYAYVQAIVSTGWNFYLRELYLSATPAKAITVEFGSFGIERGYASEITTFDDDGYIAGERVRVHHTQHLYFDEVGFTNAYFGDFGKPNFFVRGDGLGKSNYRQFFVKKRLSPRVAVSADYTFLVSHTLRQALVADIHETRLFDKVRLETYERLNSTFEQGDRKANRQGAALVGEKKIKGFTGDIGMASIDRDYGSYSGSSFECESGFSLNGDNYNTGIRVFSHAAYKINPVVTAFGFYTHLTGQNILGFNTQGLNAGLSFDLKALVNTEKVVF